MEPWPSSLVVANDQVIPAQCVGVVMVRWEIPLGVENGLIESTLEPHLPEGIYIARTLVQDCREVPVRALNAVATRSSQNVSPWHNVSVTLVTPPDLEQTQVCNTTPKLQDVTAPAKPNLSDTEPRELQELLTKYRDISLPWAVMTMEGPKGCNTE
jgi:hypothetical protein